MDNNAEIRKQKFLKKIEKQVDLSGVDLRFEPGKVIDSKKMPLDHFYFTVGDKILSISYNQNNLHYGLSYKNIAQYATDEKKSLNELYSLFTELKKADKLNTVYVNAINHFEDSNHEESGNWYEIYRFEIEGVSLDKDKGEAFPVYCTSPLEEKNLFVLSMVFSDGDSFGSSEGKGEVLAVFQDEDLAQKNYDRISQLLKNNSETYSFKIEIMPNVFFNISNPASGYFANVSHLNLEGFSISNKQTLFLKP